MKRILLPAALICAAALLVPAQAGAIIQLDRGISGVRLGNTKPEVRAALGQPKRVINRQNIFGPFTLFRYGGGIEVAFQGRRRVSQVSTRGIGDRTARGVGVGSTRQAVRNRVARVRCRGSICQRGRGEPGDRITAFFLRNGRVVRVIVARIVD